MDTEINREKMETEINREKMETEINNDFQIAFSEESQSDSTIRCHLSPVISAVDMEIRWFKETDCVCFYKNTRLIEGESYKGIMRLCIEELERGIVSLQLKDVRESYVGNYLCQVTRGDRTAEITIRKSLKTNDEVPQKTTKLWSRQIKIWNDEERTKMANSALLAVFNRLETDAPKEVPQGIDATVLQTDLNVEDNQDETEGKNTQQDYKGRHMLDNMGFPGNGMETCTFKQEEQETHLGNQQLGFASQKLLENDVKMCIFRTAKTNEHDKDFTDMLQSRIENLTEVPTVDESDIIVVFCPVVSRAGTDIDIALERFTGKTETKLAVLVVLHHTFDSEKIVPDSSRCVNRTDILTVDCLFYEDKGLLKCQKNSDAVDKVVNWLMQQGRQTGVKICPRSTDLTTNDLTNPGKNQTKPSKRQKMGYYEPSTSSKLAVLVVLHHTFDPEKIVPNSSRCVNRTDILTVDCLFYEDTGLLKCQKNSDSTDKTVNWLIQQGAKIGITISPYQHKSSNFTSVFTSLKPEWLTGFSKPKPDV